MLRSLSLEGFRGFRRFSMTGLGRVNLCVGTNNCGKTSVLEAVSLLAGRGRPEALWRALSRRGKRLLDDVSARGPVEVDVFQLFHGEGVGPGGCFTMCAQNDTASQLLMATIVERGTPDPRGRALATAGPFDSSEWDIGPPGRLELDLHWSEAGEPGHERRRLPITLRGGLRSVILERYVRRGEDDGSPVRFITTESLGRDEVVALFDSIVLTPEEDMVIDALRSIEPSIERIAAVGSGRRPWANPLPISAGGILVKLAGSKGRIPIGSMGDGIWRLLGIALSLARARGGILLVDEIDASFHYTVMADMWRLVRGTAARLDVQVFATTHSRDCVESLAAISRADATSESEVSIQRIEPGREEAVSFSEREIVIAAERAIEAR